MQKLVFTNGGGQTIDLTSGNFGITNWEGLSGVGLNIQTQQVPFQDGGVFLDALMEQREISVTVAIQDNNDLSARYERKRQLISALNPKLGEGVLVYTNDYLSRQIKAVPQLPIFENKNSNDAGTLKANVTFSCPSPYWEDTEDTVVELELGEEKNITNSGDIPVQMKIEFEINNVNTPSIIRQDGMSIGYNDKLETDLIINTNFGEKKVEKAIETFQIVNPKINTICFNQNKNLYVATGRNILISKDGTNFEDLQIEAKGVAYSPDKNIYVAIRYNGEWLVSADGKNWEEHNNIGVSANLVYICYLNRKFYICTESSSYILSSENGIDWESHSPALAYPSSIAYAEDTGLYVCVGDGHFSYSTDGENWTQSTTALEGQGYGVAYSSELGLFVIAGANGKFYITRNGITAEVINIGDINPIVFITYSKTFKKFYASPFVEAGNSKIFTSQDGYNWEQTTLEGNLSLSCLTAIDINNIVILSGANFITKTTNGTDWNIPTNIGIVTNIAYIDELEMYVILIGQGGGKAYQIATSNNGKDWNIRFSSMDKELSFRGITYAEGLGIVTSATSSNINYLLTSLDGIVWEATEINYGLNKIVYAEEKELFIATSGADILKSSDGINWDISLSNENSFNVAYSEELGLFISVGQYISISTNATNWTRTLTAGSGEYFTKVIFAKGQFIAISSSRIVTSTDGTNWSSVPATSLENIIYSKQKKIFYGVIGKALYKSENLFYWEKYQNIKGVNGLYFAINQNRLVVGELFLYYSEVSGYENAIANLTQNSNMNLNIENGLNTFRLNRIDGNFSARIKYRQKYIGV